MDILVEPSHPLSNDPVYSGAPILSLKAGLAADPWIRGEKSQPPVLSNRELPLVQFFRFVSSSGTRTVGLVFTVRFEAGQ